MNDLLADDHLELDRLLAEIFAAMDAGEVKAIYQKLDFFWARLAMHIRAEHLHLFPAILGAVEKQEQSVEKTSLPPEYVAEKIACLQDDHNFFMRELLAAIKQMPDLREKDNKDSANRLLTVRETITGISHHLETHNEREETEVYGWAEQLLDQSELADLSGRMQKELDNLPPRFGVSNKV